MWSLLSVLPSRVACIPVSVICSVHYGAVRVSCMMLFRGLDGACPGSLERSVFVYPVYVTTVLVPKSGKESAGRASGAMTCFTHSRSRMTVYRTRLSLVSTWA